MNPIEAFIFDLDGVITDTAELHYQSWQRWADEEHIPFSRAANEALRGRSRKESLELILAGREVPEEIKQEWMDRKNNYYRELLSQLSPKDVLPGVLVFLERARSTGIKLGLASASKNARDVLKTLDVIDLFDAIGDGYSVVNAKPAPDLFVWVAGRLNVSPGEVVVFEDAEAGVEAALNGGFFVVGCRNENLTKAHVLAMEGLAELTPELVIERWRQIS
ncbi:MAG: beta-phosphoglucomutase [Anaerolineae bacterium]|jgi:beta-phosphoglucomutase|nr:beta-phosphoglucomutase [Anaerolineae bacterium]